MQLYHEYSSVMHTNTYIAVEGRRAFVVDPGDADCALAIKAKLDALHARLDAILITHAHFDHIAGVAKLKRLYEEEAPKIYMHRRGEECISSKKNLGKYMGIKVEPFVPDVLLDGGETLELLGHSVQVIYTPGHSEDGVCYKIADRIFTGDAIFFCTYGRTDLYGGDFATLKASILSLFALSGNYVLLPGHGEPTTLEFERRNNPILTDSPDADPDLEEPNAEEEDEQPPKEADESDSPKSAPRGEDGADPNDPD